MTAYIRRFFRAPKKSFFLFGPRGTGKSTLIREQFPDALVLDFLSPDTRLRYTARPELLFEVVRALPDGTAILLDEIQKVPQLLTVVHALIEEKRGWQFILTGSSSRKLKRGEIDLLGGRALKKMLHPFMAAELEGAFNLDEAVSLGMLPLALAEKEERRETLFAYVSLYIDEEVKAEGLVQQVEPFSRFLEAISFSHASQINLSNVAMECSVKRSTAQNWLGILEDLLIAYQLPVFTKKAKRALSAHSKFYFFDAGVFQAIRPRSILDAPSEIGGMALEGLVAQHLWGWKDYTEEKHDLYFWRTRSGVEVDFILTGPLGFWAIEVKNGTQVNKKDLKGLESFLEDYPEAEAFLLYRGKERRKIGEILCVPCEEFLKGLTPNHMPFSKKFG